MEKRNIASKSCIPSVTGHPAFAQYWMEPGWIFQWHAVQSMERNSPFLNLNCYLIPCCKATQFLKVVLMRTFAALLDKSKDIQLMY